MPRAHRDCAVFLVLLALIGCSSNKKTPPPMPADTARVAVQPARPAPPPPRFAARFPGGAAELRELQRELGEERFALVLRVNRVDLNHVRDTDTLAVPDSALSDLDLSPLPRDLAAAAGLPKLILVSARVQAFGAYESGQLVRWGATSTGRKTSPTPARLYHVSWKAKQRTSTVNDEWLLKWCVNIDNPNGISLHEYDLPGYPASHSCVRLVAQDAEWVYDWVDQWKLTDDGARVVDTGTPVAVIDEYAFGHPRPWRQLTRDPLAASVSLEEVEGALGRYGLWAKSHLAQSDSTAGDTARR